MNIGPHNSWVCSCSEAAWVCAFVFVAVAVVLVRQTERCVFLEVSPEGQLLHAESEACSRADFLHIDFLEPDALKAGAFKRSETDAQKYRHDISMKLHTSKWTAFNCQ
jgi:hypothetical protein